MSFLSSFIMLSVDGEMHVNICVWLPLVKYMKHVFWPSYAEKKNKANVVGCHMSTLVAYKPYSLTFPGFIAIPPNEYVMGCSNYSCSSFCVRWHPDEISYTNPWCNNITDRRRMIDPGTSKEMTDMIDQIWGLPVTETLDQRSKHNGHKLYLVLLFQPRC